MSTQIHESSVYLETSSASNVVIVELAGKLEREDYREFLPVLERAIEQHGKVRLLLVMTDFHGWKAAALWEDVKFDVKHFTHFERIAMVGDKAWEHGMAVFCKPFTTAKVKYFDRGDLDEAKRWIQE